MYLSCLIMSPFGHASFCSGSDFLRRLAGDRSHQPAGGVGDFHEEHHGLGSGTPLTRLHHR